MNNPSAKEILSAYRSDGSDARDKNFEKALEQCRHDPELRAWFADQIQFDASVARGLRQICDPEEGKQAILTLFQVGERVRQKFWGRIMDVHLRKHLPRVFTGEGSAQWYSPALVHFMCMRALYDNDPDSLRIR